ncbi:MAG TPA: hypothetical protein VNS88_15535 [Nitrospiraceae bacterium]|nr:hypothetical protein [Nitrospiraceae bacterium]HWJ48126.1 hypothetical protein [Candidatus Udaeobacter sp.]
MRFSNRWGLGLSSVLLWISIASAQDRSSQVTVLVNDSVGVTPSVLRQAEREAARLFEAAGIEIQWVSCAETDECRHILGPKEFVLHIVPMGNTRNDFVFGEAFLGEDGRGQYSDVFFDRLRQAQGDVDLALLLGAVSAHELGHLLLGSHAHSGVGIMEPRWKRDSVRRIGMGTLMFTPEQARRMKTRITGETVYANLSRSQSWRTGDRFHTFRQVGFWAERF